MSLGLIKRLKAPAVVVLSEAGGLALERAFPALSLIWSPIPQGIHLV